MKRLFLMSLTVAMLVALPVIAHHMAEGTVDEEIYEMIDALVADTPHAELDFSSVPGMMTLTIEMDNYRAFERLVDGGFVEDIAMLDGEVSMTMEFDETREIVVTVTQIEEIEGKSMETFDSLSWDQVKGLYY